MKKRPSKPSAKRSNTKSKTGIKSSKRLSWKQVLPVSLLLAAVGIFLVAMSQASGIPRYLTGYMDWKYTATTKYTKSFTSSDGKVCVAANFNGYYTFDGAYHWKVQKYSFGQWGTVATSKKYSANGNRDHRCFSVGRSKSPSYYRVAFDVFNNKWVTDRMYIHGKYWVWGYNHK